MIIEFEDGSFLQLNNDTDSIDLIQCAKNGKKLIMSSSKLNEDQIKILINFLKTWMEGKGNNE